MKRRQTRRGRETMQRIGKQKKRKQQQKYLTSYNTLLRIYCYVPTSFASAD
jgi:hypothetical protein